MQPDSAKLGDSLWPPVPRCAEASSLSGGWDDGGAAPAASLAPLLAALGKAGVGWSDKVSLFQQVQAALQQSGASPHLAADFASNADRLVAALLDGAGDAHFRVAAAALAALAAGLASPCSRLFEPQLDRVMTALFARWGRCLPGRQPPRLEELHGAGRSVARAGGQILRAGSFSAVCTAIAAFGTPTCLLASAASLHLPPRPPPPLAGLWTQRSKSGSWSAPRCWRCCISRAQTPPWQRWPAPWRPTAHPR